MNKPSRCNDVIRARPPISSSSSPIHLKNSNINIYSGVIKQLILVSSFNFPPKSCRCPCTGWTIVSNTAVLVLSTIRTVMGVLYTTPLFLEPSEKAFKLKHGSYHTWAIAAATGYSELLAQPLELYFMDTCRILHWKKTKTFYSL